MREISVVNSSLGISDNVWSELCTVCRNYYTDFSHYSSRDEPKGASCSVPSKVPEGLLDRLERGL